MKKFILFCLAITMIFSCLPAFAATTKLPTPANLKWNVNRQGNLLLGSASWDDVPAAGGCYDIIVYRDGVKAEDSKPRGMIITDGNIRHSYLLRSLSPDLFSVSGAYTFTIQAKGDGITYSDSEIATSPVYNFTAPSRKVATPTNLTWEKDGSLSYTGSTEEDGIYFYVYDQNKKQIGYSNDFSSEDTQSTRKTVDLTDSLDHFRSLKPDATGFYLRIRAYSANMEEAQNSDMSDFSPLYNPADYVTAGGTLDDAWNNALYGQNGAADAVEQMKSDMQKYNITNQEMADSLKYNEDMTRKLSQIEEAYCNETGISVSVQEDSGSQGYLASNGINISDVSVVGAALNAQDGSNVNLSFSEPNETPSFDSKFYKKAIAVNMDMAGVSDSKNLQIPVVVTIPLPSGVESSRFMILHYKENGSVEKIYPTITYGNGIFATFVLTSFSPFVFAEQAVAYDPLENWVTIGSDRYIENALVLIGAYKDGVLMTAASKETAIYEDNYNQILFDNFDPSGADSVKVVVWKNDGSQEPLFSMHESPLPTVNSQE